MSTFKIIKIVAKSNVYESIYDAEKSSASTDCRVSKGLSFLRIKLNENLSISVPIFIS